MTKVRLFFQIIEILCIVSLLVGFYYFNQHYEFRINITLQERDMSLMPPPILEHDI